MSRGGNIPLSGTENSRPAEHQVAETGSTDFGSGSLPCPFFDSWTHDSWLLEKQQHILDTGSELTQPSGDLCPSPERHCHLGGAVTESAKAVSSFSQTSCYRVVENMARPVNSMNMGPLLLFFRYEVKPSHAPNQWSLKTFTGMTGS